jgi:hypothetical protein
MTRATREPCRSRTAAAIARDLYRKPGSHALRRGPPRLEVKSTYARSHRPADRYEAGAAAQQDDQCVVVGQYVAEIAFLGTSHGERDWPPQRGSTDLVQNDSPMGSRHPQVERQPAARVVNTLPLGIDEDGGKGTRDSSDKVTQDGRK